MIDFLEDHAATLAAIAAIAILAAAFVLASHYGVLPALACGDHNAIAGCGR